MAKIHGNKNKELVKVIISNSMIQNIYKYKCFYRAYTLRLNTLKYTSNNLLFRSLTSRHLGPENKTLSRVNIIERVFT